MGQKGLCIPCRGGLCATCVNDVGTTTLEPKPTTKLQPLLPYLQSDHRELRFGDDASAHNDLVKVSRHELLAHISGDAQQRGSLTQMRERLNVQFERDPSKIPELIEHFKQLDTRGDGYVTLEELEQQVYYLENMIDADEGTVPMKEDLAKLMEMRDVVFNETDEADVDRLGRVHLYAFLAHALGRKRNPVEVLLYDVSYGTADKLGELLVGKKVQAVHSGVLVYGREYWYSGMVMSTKPPCTKYFGEPLAAPWDTALPMSEFDPKLPVVRVGYTFVTKQEFVRFMVSNIVKPYTGMEKYDLLTHNCNNFANDVVTFLTGEPLPSKIMELQKMALTPTMQAIRPLLNKYLGGFGEAGHEVSEDYLAKETAHPERSHQQKQLDDVSADLLADLHGINAVMIEGIVNTPVFAKITKEEDDVYEVKYLDPESATVTTACGVKKSQICPNSTWV